MTNVLNVNHDRDLEREDPGLYGTFAGEYERVLVPRRFEAPACDLLAMVESATAGPILDVGTGTGVILDLRGQTGGRFALCVGIDPSIGMLRVARSKDHADLVVASTPGLPFSGSVFGAVIANFVLSHVDSIDDSLKDMVRVLRSGGRLAVSSWGEAENVYRSIWLETVGEFIDQESLNKAAHKAVPNEDTLGGLGNLEQALRGSGLTEVRGHVETYQKSETALEFVETRSSLVSSRIMAGRLGPQSWQRFRDCVRERLLSNFSEPLKYPVNVNVALGSKA